MPKTTNPDATACTSFLASQGLTAPGDIADHLQAAIDEWEELTGFRPFLAAAAETTWTFDPPKPGDVLDLKGGFVTVSEVRLGIIPGVSTGTVLNSATDYDLLPLNAALEPEQRGWTKIRLRNSIRSGSLQVYRDLALGQCSVKGKRGWGVKIPTLVYQRIVERTASLCLPEIIRNAGNLRRLDQSVIKQDYNEVNTKSRDWDARFWDAATDYARETY